MVRTPDPRGGRTSGLPAAGVVPDLAEKLIGELQRPVVILGEAGAGKSTVADLALLALADALALDPSARGKVPVRVELGSWDLREGLVSWAARRIRSACREQGLDGVDAKVARALVQRDMVRLVLDGFDDVPADRAAVALQKLPKPGWRTTCS